MQVVDVVAMPDGGVAAAGAVNVVVVFVGIFSHRVALSPRRARLYMFISWIDEV